MNPEKPLVLYGAAGSGSVAVEATLLLLGIAYEVVESATWESQAERERIAPINPMRQVPALIYPNGEIVTESAAILLDLADRNPAARLSPALDAPTRRQFLRWMTFVSSAIYALYWIKDEPGRIGFSEAQSAAAVAALHERIAHCWQTMDRQIEAHTYLLGDEMTVLDLYVTVVSRFGPWRVRFYETAPRMSAVVRRIDGDQRLVEFWRQRFAFRPGID